MIQETIPYRTNHPIRTPMVSLSHWLRRHLEDSPPGWLLLWLWLFTYTILSSTRIFQDWFPLHDRRTDSVISIRVRIYDSQSDSERKILTQNSPLHQTSAPSLHLLKGPPITPQTHPPTSRWIMPSQEESPDMVPFQGVVVSPLSWWRRPLTMTTGNESWATCLH